MTRFTHCCFLLLMLLHATNFANGDEFRKWTVNNSRTVEARFVEVKHGRLVFLEDKNGRKRPYPISSLSDRDRKYLEDREKTKDKKSDGNSMKKELEGDDATSGEMKDESADGNAGIDKDAKPSKSPELSVLKSNWSEAEETIVSAGSGWKFTQSRKSEVDFVPTITGLPGKEWGKEFVQNFIVNQQARRAAILYSYEDEVRLVVVDLERRRLLTNKRIDSKYQLHGFHPDGERILVERNSDTQHGTLETWVISRSDVTATEVWQPYSEDDLKGIQKATFLDENRLLTMSEQGRIAVWDFKDRRAVFHFQLPAKCYPAISDDHQYLAFCAEERLGIVDLKSGDLVGMKPAIGMKGEISCAFSPTGRQLAAGLRTQGGENGKVMVWDTENGKVLFDNRIAGISGTTDLQMPADDFLLCFGDRLFEVSTSINVWTYSDSMKALRFGSHVYCVVDKAIVPVEMPHETAAEALKSAKLDEQLTPWKKGGKVKLNLDAVPDQYKVEISQLLTKSLTDFGMTIADDAVVTLNAGVKGPWSDKVTYESAGTFEVTKYLSTLTIVYDSYLLWNNSRENIPFILTGKRDKTVGQILKEASAGPEMYMFQAPEFPLTLQRVKDKTRAPKPNTTLPVPPQFLGTSKVTAVGVD